MKLKIIILFVISTVTLTTAAKGKFEIHGGVAVPSFEFSNKDTEYGGSAASGLNLGLKYVVPFIYSKGLSFTIGIDYLSNDINSEGKTYLENNIRNTLSSQSSPYVLTDLTMDYFQYVNIPLLVGTEYKLAIDKSKWLFLSGALGPNYSKPSDYLIHVQTQGFSVKMTESFDSKIKLAYQLGIGILYNEQYSIGLSYNALGLYKYNSKETYESSGQSMTEDNEEALQVNISTFNATFGIRF